MDLIISNVSWMTLNVSLALIAVALGWCIIKTNSWPLRVLFGLLWILFMPNTLYIMTDLKHVPWQLTQVRGGALIIILLQFSALITIGIITFVVGLAPLELILRRVMHIKKRTMTWTLRIPIILFNFIIGFGIVLGRIHRLHSWYLFTDTQSVIASAVTTLTSPSDFAFVLLMGVLGSALYFSLAGRILPYVQKP